MRQMLVSTVLATAIAGAGFAQNAGTPPPAAASTAQPLALLLEQGIYQEQTAGNPEAAARTYALVVEQAAVSRVLAGQALARLAVLQSRQKQRAEAAKTLQRLKREYPEQADLLARTTAAVGNPPPGPAELPAKAEEPPTPEARAAAESAVEEGWRLLKDRNYADARAAFDKAMKLDRTLSNAYAGHAWTSINEGTVVSRTGHSNVQQNLHIALQLDPKNAQAHSGLGWLQWKFPQGGNKESAINHWKAALEYAPEATSPMSGLAQASLELRRYDDAVMYFERWLKLEPRNEDAAAGLATAREGAAHVKAARAVADKFLAHLDAGAYAETRGLFPPGRIRASFNVRGRTASTDDQTWEETLQRFRTPRGKPVARTMANTHEPSPPFGDPVAAAAGRKLAGSGGFGGPSPEPDAFPTALVFAYTTHFPEDKMCQEALTVTKEQDGVWRVVTYSLHVPERPIDPLKAGG